MHVGAEKFHIFHLHGGGDRWRYNPVADKTFDYTETGLEKDPPVDPVRLAAPRLAVDRPGRVVQPRDRGRRGRRAAEQRRLPVPLPHRQALRLGHVGPVARLQHAAARLRAARRPGGTARRASSRPPWSGRTLQRHEDHHEEPRRAGSDRSCRRRASRRPARTRPCGTGRSPGRAPSRVYLGAPADPTVYPDSPNGLPGQPNLLAVDAGTSCPNRPAILFNPVNGRPAYPMFRPHIGQRPPFTGNGHTGTPYLGNNAAAPKAATTDPVRRTRGRPLPGQPPAAHVQRRRHRACPSSARRPSPIPRARSSCSPTTRRRRTPIPPRASRWPSAPTRATASA